MTIRFRILLLSLAFFAGLNACSTGRSRPAGEPSSQRNLPATEDARTHGIKYDPYNFQKGSADHNLAKTAQLVKSMSGYNPDLALEILRSLESIRSGQLVAMIENQWPDPVLTEWLELSLEVRTLLINQGSVTSAAREWENHHFGHPVNQANFSELVYRYKGLFPTPTRVAVLLPSEGGLANAARVIRDGVLTAYLERPGGSAIRFYSSGESSESAIAAYRQAMQDGATQVVGPLRLESTRMLAGLDNPGVPILLLNEPDSNRSVNPDQANLVASLSLAQSEEAEAIATTALAQGYRRAIVIVPDNAWGQRIGTTFATVFEQGEGQIQATASFAPDTGDHGNMLTGLLKIDESKWRKTNLQTRLGIPLDFEPVRRDDFDFIFLAADPAIGREFKPLLRFHNAGDIPVYSMGRIFSGKVEPGKDQDLNDIVFPITPWQLKATDNAALKLESIRGGEYGNLYALGRDAWQLLPWLPLMQKDPDLRFPGDTGVLRLHANGHLFRQPAWAQFSDGQPVTYQWPNYH